MDRVEKGKCGGRDKGRCAHLGASPLSAHRFRYAHRSMRCAHGFVVFLYFMGLCGVHKVEIKVCFRSFVRQSHVNCAT